MSGIGLCRTKGGQVQTTPTGKDNESVRLRDGMQVVIRPIRADDAPRLQSLFGRLSRESIYYRFLGLRKELSSGQARRLADLDYRTQMALAASCGEGCEERLIGVARYSVIPGSRPVEAEAAIVVEDRYQGKGLGTLLLERLVAYAVAHGVRTFLAEISQDNGRILRLIRRSGLPVQSCLEAGVLLLRVGLGREPCGDIASGGPIRERGRKGPEGRIKPCSFAIV